MTSQHALQARDDSIAGFQLLQPQSPSPKDQQRLDHTASQLQDTQAQLLTTQVLGPSAGKQNHMQHCYCMTTLHDTTRLWGNCSLLGKKRAPTPLKHLALCLPLSAKLVTAPNSTSWLLQPLLALLATKLLISGASCKTISAVYEIKGQSSMWPASRYSMLQHTCNLPGKHVMEPCHMIQTQCQPHLVIFGSGASTVYSRKSPLLQAKVQEGDVQLDRLQTALQSQQARNNQLQNTLQATEAQLQEAHGLTDAEHLRVTLLQEAASAREAAMQLLHQQLGDAEQKVQQQVLELQVKLIFTARLQCAHLLLGRPYCLLCWGV